MSSLDDPEQASRDRGRLKNHFEQRSRKARDGKHLPTLTEHLRGCPFLAGDMAVDAQTFAERVLPRIRSTGPVANTLREKLAALGTMPDLVDIRAAADAFRAAAEIEDFAGPDPAKGALRCDLYAAVMGCRTSAWRIATAAAAIAQDGATPEDEAVEYATTSANWLLFAFGLLPSGAHQAGARTFHSGDPRDEVERLGRRIVSHIMAPRQRAIAERSMKSRWALSPAGEELSLLHGIWFVGPVERLADGFVATRNCL